MSTKDQHEEDDVETVRGAPPREAAPANAEDEAKGKSKKRKKKK